jgi:hypothetical protein
MNQKKGLMFMVKEELTGYQIAINTAVITLTGPAFQWGVGYNHEKALEYAVKYEHFVRKDAAEYSSNLEHTINEQNKKLSGSELEAALAGKDISYFNFLGEKDKANIEKIETAFAKNDVSAAKGIIGKIKSRLNDDIKYKDARIQAEKTELLFKTKETYLTALCFGRIPFLCLDEGLTNATEYLKTDNMVFNSLPGNACDNTASMLGDFTFILYYLESIDPKVTEKINKRLTSSGFAKQLAVYETIIKTTIQKAKISEKELRKIGCNLFERIKTTQDDHKSVSGALGEEYNPEMIDEG